MKLPFIVARVARVPRVVWPPGYTTRVERLREKTNQTVQLYERVWQRIRDVRTSQNLDAMLTGSLFAFTSRPLYYMPWST